MHLTFTLVVTITRGSIKRPCICDVCKQKWKFDHHLNSPWLIQLCKPSSFPYLCLHSFVEEYKPQYFYSATLQSITHFFETFSTPIKLETPLSNANFQQIFFSNPSFQKMFLWKKKKSERKMAILNIFILIYAISFTFFF